MDILVSLLSLRRLAPAWRIAAAGLALAAAGPARAAPGDPLWSFPTGDVILSSPAVDAGGNVYFGSLDQFVYSLDADGAPRWQTETGDWVASSPALSADESVVYVGSWDNRLYALDAASGAIQWTFETSALIHASPAVAASGRVVFGSSDGFLYSVNPDGTLAWETLIGGELDSSPAIDQFGRIYLGSTSGEVAAVDADGGIAWITALDVDPDHDNRVRSSPALSGDGALYIGSGNRYLYALDTDTGEVLWKFQAADAVDTSPAIGIDGSVIFAARDGNLYSLNSDGFVQWQTFVGDVFFSSPAVDSLGRIYLGSFVGEGLSALLAVSPFGSLLWEAAFTDFIDSSPAIGPDGTVYVGSNDFSMNAFRGSGKLASGPWPKFGRDLGQRGTQEGYEAAAPAPEGLVNLSVRGPSEGVESSLIAGFVIEGTEPKELLVRGLGPGLEAFGVDGAMEDPKLSFFEFENGENALVAANGDWGEADDPEAIQQANEDLGAPLLEEGSRDSAALLSLPAGVYTGVSGPESGDGGVMLMELFDANASSPDARLVNMSMRGVAGTGSEVMIAGFVIGGTAPRQALIRGLGPALADRGVTGHIGDPTLRLFIGQREVASNDQWTKTPDRDLMESVAAEVGAAALDEADGDSALLLWLEPGAYTAMIQDASGESGVALFEIFLAGP